MTAVLITAVAIVILGGAIFPVGASILLGIFVLLLALTHHYVGRLRQSLQDAKLELAHNTTRQFELSGLAADVFWEQTQQCQFVRITPASSRTVKFTKLRHWIGKALWEIESLEPVDGDWAEYRNLLAQRAPFRDLLLKSTDGVDATLYISLSGHPVLGSCGEFAGYRGIARDVSSSRSIAGYLAYLTLFDKLTGLPAKSALHDTLKKLLLRARRSLGNVGCVLIEIDQFSSVSKSFGQRIGEELLVHVAHRLHRCLRGEDTFGRFSDDQFGILLPDLQRPDGASLVAIKIQAALAAPFILSGREFFVTASIGISTCPDDGDESDELIRHAASALKRVRASGGNGYQFYLPLMNLQINTRMRTELKLRSALSRDELIAEYQPIVDLSTGAPSGFEALLRWKTEQSETLTPPKFLPILEDTGLIVPVGEMVLRKTCQQIRAWGQLGLKPLRVSINVSARQFLHDDFVEGVRRTINEAGVDPQLVQIEVAESLLMRNPDEAFSTLTGLKEIGVRLSLDDFGSGLTSISWLQRFPLDEIKIFPALIHSAVSDHDRKIAVIAIFNIARIMRLNVVAKGVETGAQLRSIHELGCNEAQGHFLFWAMDIQACTDLQRRMREGLAPTAFHVPRIPDSLVLHKNPANTIAIKRRETSRDERGSTGQP